MTSSSAESYAYDTNLVTLQPLNANDRLYTFDEIVSAPSYFQLDGAPVQLHCTGLEKDNDGYNPSGIHAVKVHASDTATTPVTIVRTEKDTGAYSAESRFCQYEESGRLTELDIERRPWEDASICTLPDGTIVTSGVRVIWNKQDPTKHDRFFTEFYTGDSLDNQVYLGQSPDGHKDSHLAVIDGEIVLWTRPQQRSFEGKIHYTKLSDIAELSANSNDLGEKVATEVYDRCQPVGAGIFADGTWGGPNGAVDVGGGWALIQCHVSRQTWVESETALDAPENELLKYDGFMIMHHPSSGEAMIFGSHVTEEQFPPGGSKWPKVRKVVFPGGLHNVKVYLNGNIAGEATVGDRDKDMYAIRWKTTQSIARLLNIYSTNLNNTADN